jgi:hypothetical protein
MLDTVVGTPMNTPASPPTPGVHPSDRLSEADRHRQNIWRAI